jgi:large conductance mechanosensitive channel
MATKKATPVEPAPNQVVMMPAPEKHRFGSGFMGFIRQYHVIPLAIAVVLGNALNDVVKTLVDGIITPLISLVVPSTSLQEYQWQVKSSTFHIGSVISAVISFLVVALVVYVFAKKVLRDDSILEKK